MKVLVTGNGGREHAIAAKVALNCEVEKIFCAKGNAGTSGIEKCENVELDGVEEFLEFAKENKIDLTIVGSEDLLVSGIVDRFEKNGLKIIGPNKSGARLEGSKAFAKDFMKKYGIKTAKYEVFTDAQKAKEYIEKNSDFPVVIKASGLAAGKGVIIAQNLMEAKKAIDDLMVDKSFGSSGEKVVIEEFLDGVEASILSITDCKTIIPFISAKDHKKILEGEKGLNTGGMGAIAPNPYVTKEVYKEFLEGILNPTLRGIQEENMDFAGFIFFGLMITSKGVYLLEYNMRLGDPETQAILPLLENDFVDVILKAISRKLDGVELKWRDKKSCCVVLASKGYPLKYEKGYKISGLENVERVYMAGVSKKNENYLTNGGRVLNVVCLADSLEEARKNCYKEIEKINFEGKYFRKDIGKI